MNTMNLTEDGKIKTIRYLKATHEDFAKLVNEGKKIIAEFNEMVEKTGITFEDCKKKVEEKDFSTINIDGEEKNMLWLYNYYIERKSVLDGYNRAYKFLMEEGVDELLLSIDIGPESYNYNFYKLCLEN